MCVLDRISMLLKEQDKKQKDLCNYLGISKNVFTDWKGGRNKSYRSYLPAIANYFGVSVDYLLGNTDERRPAPGRPIAIMGADTKHGGVRMVDTPENAKISEIRDYLDRFTVDQLDDVLQYVKFIDSKI